MNDRELLELAAKAAGIGLTSFLGGKEHYVFPLDWNPLTDDGDALRLAVKLNIDLLHETSSDDMGDGQSVTFPLHGDYDSITEWHKGDKLAATRRAIVRAGAVIGKAMT